MEDWLLYARLGLSIFNLTILVILIFIYFKRFRELSSRFTLGFLLFSLALFFRTFFASPIIKVFILGLGNHSIVDPYKLIADVFEMFSLVILLYLTTR